VPPLGGQEVMKKEKVDFQNAMLFGISTTVETGSLSQKRTTLNC